MPLADDPATPRSQQKSAWRIFRRLLEGFSPHPWMTVVTAIAMAVVLGVELALPRVLGEAVQTMVEITRPMSAGLENAPTEGDSRRSMMLISVLYLVLAVIGLLARFGGGVARTVLVQRILTDLRLSIHSAIQGLSFRWHGQHSPGEVLSRATRDVEKIRAFYADVIATGGEIAIVIAGSVIMISLLSPLLGGIAFVLVTGMLFQVLALGRHLRGLWRSTDDSYDEVTLAVQETVAGARVVRAFGREPDQTERFHKVTETYVQKFLKAISYWAFHMPLANMVFNFSVPALILTGGWLVMRGGLELGALAAAIFYLSAISTKLRVIGRLIETSQDAIASSERIHELLDREEAINASGGGAPAPQHPATIRFEGVSLAGDAEQVILDDITLEIPAGATVAFVGRTGSGKSTLAALVPRFHDPDRGRVLLDGRDLRELDVTSLRGGVALVFQDTFLFSATIRENIAFGKPGATEEQVIEAARLSQAHEFIEAMPDGFDTVVGERGITLSGGQKQRLAIARAYLIDPSILIMDDATASVDSRTERRLQEAARGVTRGRTTILIAHRFSTLEHADCIHVLDDGRLVESGTHAELLERGGLYAELNQAQLMATSDDDGTSQRAPTQSAERLTR